MYKSICLIALLSIMSFSVSAHDNHYVIQLAAVKVLDLNQYQSVEEYGDITVSDAGNNIKRVRLGSFESSDDAKGVLIKVQSMGFNDAFIVSEGTADVVAAVVDSNIDYGNPLKHPAWKHLTTEQRNNIVVLDGKLHVKEAGKFIPLDQFE